jgi:uncharacterized protein (TIRG00374 family)
MKRAVGIAVRLVLAAVGLGLIVVLIALNWHGQAVLPAGYMGADQPERRIRIEAVEGEAPHRLFFLAGEEAPTKLAESDFSPAQDTATRIPGMLEMLGEADKALLALGLLLAGLAFPIQAYRWLLLMRCRGMSVGYGQALRLTLVGQFFSVCLPGATGGDLVKAYYAAKGSGARARAVMSVITDRVCGMIGLVALVALIGFGSLGDPLVRSVTIGAWTALAALTVLALLYTSPTLRGLLKLGALAERLPARDAIRAIDEAAVGYRDHKPTVLIAVGLSVVAHVCFASATAVAGQGLGLQTPWLVLMALIPVVLLLGAVPIMPSGLGVMEGAAVLLIDAPMGLIIGMMLVYRLYLLAFALAGAGVTLRGNIHLHPAAIEQQIRRTDEQHITTGDPA